MGARSRVAAGDRLKPFDIDCESPTSMREGASWGKHLALQHLILLGAVPNWPPVHFSPNSGDSSDISFLYKNLKLKRHMKHDLYVLLIEILI